MPRSIRKRRSPCCRSPRSSSTGRICRSRPTPRSCKACWTTVIARLPDDLDIRILPIQAVGKSNEHLHAPGTLTLPAATLIEAWTELGASVARAGVRKLVVVNSHGGNEEIMGIVTRELRVRHGMLAVKTSWQRFGRPAGMYHRARRPARHPWRRRRDVADAAFPARPGRHGARPRISSRTSPGPRRSSSCCATPARMPSPGSPATSTRMAWSATQRSRRPRRAG